MEWSVWSLAFLPTARALHLTGLILPSQAHPLELAGWIAHGPWA